MVTKEKEVLSEFYLLCGQILGGTVKEEDAKRITKAMIDTNQQAIMGEEFNKIANLLSKDRICH